MLSVWPWLKRHSLFIGFALLAGPTPAIAQKSFILDRPVLLRSALATNLNWRCNGSYHYSGTRLGRIRACHNGVRTFIAVMNQVSLCRVIDQGKKSCGVVVLTDDLKRSLTDPISIEFLKRLDSHIDDLKFVPGFKLDILGLALESWSTTEMAYKNLAVLFQDTSEIELHLRWLTTQSLSPKAKYGFDLLRAVTARLRAALLDGDRSTRIRFLPFASPNSQLGAYHYFVIAEFRRRLELAGIEPSLARYLPFLLNYIYEVQRVAGRQILHSFVEPKVTLDRHTIGDLYLGYRAVTWHLPGYQAVSFERFASVARTDRQRLFRFQ